MAGEFAKLTDLFQEGEVLALQAAGQTVTVWINKLSPFEMEEARQDGRVAKARATLAITEVGSPEYDVFRAGIAEISDTELISELLDQRMTEWTAKAVRGTRQDEVWREKVEVIEQSTGELRPDELAAVAKITEEWSGEIDQRVAEDRAEEKALLEGATREQLEQKYREQYLENVGLQSFQKEYWRTEVYFALRACRANETTTEEQALAGEWHHDECDHNKRVCDSRAQVASLPEGLWRKVRGAIDHLNMPLDIARFSAAPESSSASSEQSSEAAEASEPSTPEVTPAEPAGIS